MANWLGAKVGRLRKEAGFSLARFAEVAGCSKTYIWELEHNSRPRPSAEMVAKIAQALGVTSEFLLSESELAPTSDVVDEAFFILYRRLDSETKEKIRLIVEILGKGH